VKITPPDPAVVSANPFAKGAHGTPGPISPIVFP
jgi:hypothetical protein